ncbi:MAG TPA: hypothetical protein DCM54_18090 [Gammaproteobacteria bacterium]|nr:hypothetical protein [Gammaproteobacteria bacterium]|tara:strand:- start:68 stop:838 length:771 start_codon:yes stop_codon:yes gene_type:complete
MKKLALFAILWVSPAVGELRQFDFSGVVLTGDTEGFMQTPAGGLPNRSDIARPTFQELGIEKITSYSFKLGLRRDKNRYFVGASAIRDKKNTRLEQDLLSQWQQFRAGDETVADIQLDWYRVGYLRHFQSGISDQLSYALGADATLFSFHYQLTNGVQMVDREYNKGGYRIGATARYEFGHDLSLNFSAFLPLQGSSTADITSIDVVGEYRFNELLSGTLGFAILEIDYKDAQTFPNHIVVEMEPQIRAGFVLTTR